MFDDRKDKSLPEGKWRVQTETVEWITLTTSVEDAEEGMLWLKDKGYKVVCHGVTSTTKQGLTYVFEAEGKKIVVGKDAGMILRKGI